MDRIPHREALFYQGELIQCLSYHVDYACSCGGVAMSSGDRTGFNARGRLWPCFVIEDIKCRRFLRTRLQWHLSGIEIPWARLSGARACSSRGDKDLQRADR
jgi:hypothetical protein